MSHGIDSSRSFRPSGIAVLTVSDSRTLADDQSGDLLIQRLRDSGHRLVERQIVTDDVSLIQEQLRDWVMWDQVQVILTTGGTGVDRTGVDYTLPLCIVYRYIPNYPIAFGIATCGP